MLSSAQYFDRAQDSPACLPPRASPGAGRIASLRATCLIPLDLVFSSMSHETSGNREKFALNKNLPYFREQYPWVFSLT